MHFILESMSDMFSADGGFVPSVRQAALPYATARQSFSYDISPFVSAARKPAIELSPAPIVEIASPLLNKLQGLLYNN